MTNEEATLHLTTLNAIRHNFQMLKIVRNSSPDDLRVNISKEMSLFCDGITLLADGKFAAFSDWFMANTDDEIATLILSNIRMEVVNEESEPSE